jgi:DNA-binding transcriptional ArsR family regulator
MKIALYARTSAADLGRVTVEDLLTELAGYAERRGWQVVVKGSDRGPWLEGRREGLESVLASVRDGLADGVLVRSLSQIARSLRHLTELGRLLGEKGVALVAIEELVDTTDPGGSIRWRDWLEISSSLDQRLRSEGSRVARLRSAGEWGRPYVAVNPLELLGHWEGRGNRRPLSTREVAVKIGVSQATVRARLRELREAGKVDDEARRRALAARGGLHKGGRPGRPLNEADLTAAWEQCPSLSALARRFRVGRQRIQNKLKALGLLEAQNETER